MITSFENKILVLLSILVLCEAYPYQSYKVTNSSCRVIIKVKTRPTLIIDCAYGRLDFNSKKHEVKFYDQRNLQVYNKPPYRYMDNGTLELTNYRTMTTYFRCEITDKKFGKPLYDCIIGLILINPLHISNAPRNETVKLYSSYRIGCIGSGGDLNLIKMYYLVNNSVLRIPKPINITGDTTIECRLESGKDVKSVVAYLNVAWSGMKTDKERYEEKKCGKIETRICNGYLSSTDVLLTKNVLRLQNYNKKSRSTVELVLDKLKKYLMDKVLPEYHEEKCLNRFMRLVCESIYPVCNNQLSTSSGTTYGICKESCEVLHGFVCQKTFKFIKKFVIDYVQLIQNDNYNSLVPIYETNFLMNLLKKIKGFLQCSQLQSINSRVPKCHILNLDILGSEVGSIEKRSVECYNGIGRNYTGNANNDNKCLYWSQIPQLVGSFYQQHLANNSNYCRNLGGLYSQPVCVERISVLKMSIDNTKNGNISSQRNAANQIQSGDGTKLSISAVRIITCTDLITCRSLRKIKSSLKTEHLLLVILAAAVMLLVISIIVIFCIKRKNMNKRKHPNKNNTTSKSVLSESQNLELCKNKSYMYQNIKSELDNPIYNRSYFQSEKELAKGAFGEIILVRVMLENSTKTCCNIRSIDAVGANNSSENTLNSNEVHNARRRFHKKSTCNNDLDDIILSSDTEFHNKPCWPFDTSTGSGHCPYAVIKYCSSNNSSSQISKFFEENKYLAQFDHNNIIRFYGVMFDSSGKINARLVEYLPNGTLKEMLNSGGYPSGSVTFNDNKKVNRNNHSTAIGGDHYYNNHQLAPRLLESGVMHDDHGQERDFISNQNSLKKHDRHYSRRSHFIPSTENGNMPDTAEEQGGKHSSINILKKHLLRMSSNSSGSNNAGGGWCIHQDMPKPYEGKVDLSVNQLVTWASQIADAVSHMHAKNYIHRDIATRNCLVAQDMQVKLSDFILTNKFVYGCNLIGHRDELLPIRWLPPESLDQYIFNHSTDTWMFGIFLWELMSRGQEPYGELDDRDAFNAITSSKLLDIPDGCSQDIYEIMKECWLDEAGSRPSMYELKLKLEKYLLKSSTTNS